MGALLKYYYWALLLSEIHPDTISFVPPNLNGSGAHNTGTTVTAGVPPIVETLIRNIKVLPEKRIDDDGEVWQCRVEYHGIPVVHMSFEYFDGFGQTDGEAVGGQTQLHLFYREKSVRQREITLRVAYRYQEEMDELLSFADSLRGTSALVNTVLLVLPADKQPVRVAVAEPVKTDSLLPPPLQMLWQGRDSLKKVLNTLNTLVRKGKIITGKAERFESLEGLYAAVVTNERLVALLRFEKGKLFDHFSRKEVQLNDFDGKQLTWIEVIR